MEQPHTSGITPSSESKVCCGKVGTIIITAIITAVVVGFGTYWLTQGVTAPTTSPTPTPTVVDTAGWKTYLNTKYNYQIQYPNDWSFRESQNGAGVNFRANNDDTPTVSGFDIVVHPNPGDLSFIDWVIKSKESDAGFLLKDRIESATVSMNGLQWKKFKDSIGMPPSSDVLYGLTYGGNVYYIVDNSGTIETIDRMLSTFRFTR